MLNKAQQVAARVAEYDMLMAAKQGYHDKGVLEAGDDARLAQINHDLSHIHFGIEDVRVLLRELRIQEIRIAGLVNEVADLHNKLHGVTRRMPAGGE